MHDTQDFTSFWENLKGSRKEKVSISIKATSSWSACAKGHQYDDLALLQYTVYHSSPKVLDHKAAVFIWNVSWYLCCKGIACPANNNWPCFFYDKRTIYSIYYWYGSTVGFLLIKYWTKLLQQLSGILLHQCFNNTLCLEQLRSVKWVFIKATV